MGYTLEKTIAVLNDPEAPRDRKEFAMSMYMFERGAESSSFMADIIRYKGHHTKETRAFKSQMRFDWEAFVDSFTRYLNMQSRLIGATLDVDIFEEKKKYEEWLGLLNNKGRKLNYIDYVMSQGNKIDHSTQVQRVHSTLVEMAIQAEDEASKLRKVIRNLADARQREKGKGIYIAADGRPYTVDDPEITEIINADRAAAKEINDQDL